MMVFRRHRRIAEDDESFISVAQVRAQTEDLVREITMHLAALGNTGDDEGDDRDRG